MLLPSRKFKDEAQQPVGHPRALPAPPRRNIYPEVPVMPSLRNPGVSGRVEIGRRKTIETFM